MQHDFMTTQRNLLEQAFFDKNKKQYLHEWQNNYERFDSLLDFNQFSFIPDISALNYLPSLSFMLFASFVLIKPYLSKDDNNFHILDNPIRKDKVFKIPMVASTSWKGSLRAALWQMGHQEENEQIIRLFGNKPKEENHKNLKSGWLYFYPTFFKKTDLIVINPHDRTTGTSKRGPIYVECVPKDAKGEFVLMYVPFCKIDMSQVAKDLEIVAEGVKAMLTVYGFGAKTSSGFGVVKEEGTGQIVINCSNTPQMSPRPQKPEYPEKVQLFLAQYPDENFQLSPKEWRKSHNATQSKQDFYRAARNERSTYLDGLKSYESDLAKWENQANAPALPQISESFSTLVEMVSKAKEIAMCLHQKKEIRYE